MKFRIKESVYNKNIVELELTTRAYNSMRRAGFKTIGDILDNQYKLNGIRGCGATVIKEVKNKILELQIASVLEV